MLGVVSEASSDRAQAANGRGRDRPSSGAEGSTVFGGGGLSGEGGAADNPGRVPSDLTGPAALAEVAALVCWRWPVWWPVPRRGSPSSMPGAVSFMPTRWLVRCWVTRSRNCKAATSWAASRPGITRSCWPGSLSSSAVRSVRRRPRSPAICATLRATASIAALKTSRLGHQDPFLVLAESLADVA